MLKNSLGLATLRALKESRTFTPENFLKGVNSEAIPKLESILYNKTLDIDPFYLIRDDLKRFSINFAKIVAADHSFLNKIISHVIENEGKKLRPAINILLAKALEPKSNIEKITEHNKKEIIADDKELDYSTIYEKKMRLSEVTELVHTGSLLHDDIIDKSEMRRGNDSVGKRFGNKVAVLGGDFFLAKASETLSLIGNTQVIGFISQSISNLVAGELFTVEADEKSDKETILNHYCLKNYLKTASLIANSCKSIAILNDSSRHIVDASFEYGKNLGLAFQVIDDILDVTSISNNSIGKPKNADMKLGLLTAPVLYAAEENPGLYQILSRRFCNEGDIEEVTKAIETGNALKRSLELAKSFALKAVESVLLLPENIHRQALISMVMFNLNRKK